MISSYLPDFVNVVSFLHILKYFFEILDAIILSLNYFLAVVTFLTLLITCSIFDLIFHHSLDLSILLLKRNYTKNSKTIEDLTTFLYLGFYFVS